MNTNTKKIKVLVVEDIKINQLLMEILLAEFGYERDVAENGKIAIEMFQAKTYDLILMDLRMPEMDGFEATEYIRHKLNSNIPIIALTADLTAADLEKCKTVGMNDYVAKPVDRDLLQSKIVKFVNEAKLIVKDDEITEMQSETFKYTNLDYLNRRTKSNGPLMMEMISAFLLQTPPLVNVMTKGIREKDWDSLYSAVHKMIPSFSIMGISSDYEKMARKVLELSHLHLSTDEIFNLVSQLEKVCNQACEELKEEYNTINNINS